MRHSILSLFAAAALLVGCSDTGPQGAVRLTFTSGSAGLTPSVSGSGAAASLTLNRVLIVVRDVELERQGVQDCDVEPEPEGCEEFKAGPEIVSLDLTGAPTTFADIQGIPEGTYVRLDFDIHKLSDSDPLDAAVLSGPDGQNLVDRSIFIEYTWDPGDGSGPVNGTFWSDLNEEQKQPLSLTVAPGETGVLQNITASFGVDQWFLDGAGALINPADGMKGMAMENVVRDNIRQAIEAFEDNDEDGLPDN